MAQGMIADFRMDDRSNTKPHKRDLSDQSTREFQYLFRDLDMTCHCITDIEPGDRPRDGWQSPHSHPPRATYLSLLCHHAWGRNVVLRESFLIPPSRTKDLADAGCS